MDEPKDRVHIEEVLMECHERIGLFRFKAEIRVENGLTIPKRLEIEGSIQLEFRQDRDAARKGRAEIIAIDLDAQDLILNVAAGLTPWIPRRASKVTVRLV
jgi:hypothetical protein